MRRSTLKTISRVFTLFEVAGLAAEITTCVTGNVLQQGAFSTYRETTEYRQSLDAKQQELIDQVNSGEITLQQSSEELAQYTSSRAVEDRMVNGNEVAVQYIYNVGQNFNYATYGLAGFSVLCAVGSVVTKTNSKEEC